MNRDCKKALARIDRLCRENIATLRDTFSLPNASGQPRLADKETT